MTTKGTNENGSKNGMKLEQLVESDPQFIEPLHVSNVSSANGFNLSGPAKTGLDHRAELDESVPRSGYPPLRLREFYPG